MTVSGAADVASDEPFVAIVGAGPAGLVAAHLLHRAGVPYVVLERYERGNLKGMAKAGSIDYRTVELLESVGIVPSILQFTTQNSCCEFRTPKEQVIIDYGALAGGRPHFIYPQHELVGRLSDELMAVGGNVRFGVEAVAVEQHDNGVRIRTSDGEQLDAGFVAGCDGGRSVIAQSLRGCDVVEHSLPVRWLAVLGETAPLETRTIYAPHPRGYAAQMRRLPTLTRFYLEVPAGDTLDDWPMDRVRDELSIRLLVPGRLDGVHFIEPSFVDLKMRMTSPMQDRRVFVVGDAAHVITPAGGKGMNLAIGDSVELALGLIEKFSGKGTARLAAYSQTRLPALWRTQAFSRWMLSLIMAGADDGRAGDGPSFRAGLRDGWVSALQNDPLLARWFAHAYAGVDPD